MATEVEVPIDPTANTLSDEEHVRLKLAALKDDEPMPSSDPIKEAQLQVQDPQPEPVPEPEHSPTAATPSSPAPGPSDNETAAPAVAVANEPAQAPAQTPAQEATPAPAQVQAQDNHKEVEPAAEKTNGESATPEAPAGEAPKTAEPEKAVTQTPKKAKKEKVKKEKPVKEKREKSPPPPKDAVSIGCMGRFKQLFTPTKKRAMKPQESVKFAENYPNKDRVDALLGVHLVAPEPAEAPAPAEPKKEGEIEETNPAPTPAAKGPFDRAAVVDAEGRIITVAPLGYTPTVEQTKQVRALLERLAPAPATQNGTSAEEKPAAPKAEGDEIQPIDGQPVDKEEKKVNGANGTNGTESTSAHSIEGATFSVCQTEYQVQSAGLWKPETDEKGSGAYIVAKAKAKEEEAGSGPGLIALECKEKKHLIYVAFEAPLEGALEKVGVFAKALDDENL